MKTWACALICLVELYVQLFSILTRNSKVRFLYPRGFLARQHASIPVAPDIEKQRARIICSITLPCHPPTHHHHRHPLRRLPYHRHPLRHHHHRPRRYHQL